ncbi:MULTISPECIES: hypothetical protein [Arthrobacter]|uniref:Sporulation protein n=1 Tax=Arthrobacter humicola TaxID=409291 RepID=A0ABN2ZNG8_9MICC|nr:hypothetical protein [Arthrobacter sp. H-02-3]PVZ59623.1 hypothetical protein C9424_05030 [Arthrobacter sp. H-02-3]
MSESFSSLVDAFKNVGVSRAYGPAATVAGEELIPVALVSFGFGGGSAPEDGQPGSGGSGGGGGGFVLPLGVYAKGPSGRVMFRPNTVVALVALAPLVCAVGVTIRGILRTVRPRG